MGQWAWAFTESLLDALEIPYVPLMGDNEVQTDDEERFTEVYASRFERLSDELGEWYKTEGPVVHPPSGDRAWLQNCALNTRGSCLWGWTPPSVGYGGGLGTWGL